MIPSVAVTPEWFETAREKTEQSKTYRINFESGRIEESIDRIEAVRQSIYCIFRTERYEWLIYRRSYGIELTDLYGKDRRFVIPQLMRRIEDALCQDDRIVGVSDFQFSRPAHGAIGVAFWVSTIYDESIKIEDKVVV